MTIDARRLNFNETANALRDGQIDAGFWSVGPPTSSILDLATTRDVVIIPLSEEEVSAAQEAEPVFAAYTLPADTYPGQSEGVTTISTPNVLITNSDMDEELAYNVTKAMYDHVDELIAIHPAANNTTVDFSLRGHADPLSPRRSALLSGNRARGSTRLDAPGVRMKHPSRKTMRKGVLLFLFTILSVGSAAPYLEVWQNDTLLLQLDLTDDPTWTLRWNHSVTGILVSDYYAYKGDR